MKKVFHLISMFFFCGIACSLMLGSASALVLTDEDVQELRAAQEADVSRASSYFAAYGAWASAVDDAEIEVGFDVIAPRIMNQLGAVEIEIMRKSGSNWISVKTYEYTDRGMGYLYESDCVTHDADVYFQGTAGREYMGYVTLKAEDDNGSETRIVVTNVVQAHK